MSVQSTSSSVCQKMSKSVIWPPHTWQQNPLPNRVYLKLTLVTVMKSGPKNTLFTPSISNRFLQKEIEREKQRCCYLKYHYLKTAWYQIKRTKIHNLAKVEDPAELGEGKSSVPVPRTGLPGRNFKLWGFGVSWVWMDRCLSATYDCLLLKLLVRLLPLRQHHIMNPIICQVINEVSQNFPHCKILWFQMDSESGPLWSSAACKVTLLGISPYSTAWKRHRTCQTSQVGRPEMFQINCWTNIIHYVELLIVGLIKRS